MPDFGKKPCVRDWARPVGPASSGPERRIQKGTRFLQKGACINAENVVNLDFRETLLFFVWLSPLTGNATIFPKTASPGACRRSRASSRAETWRGPGIFCGERKRSGIHYSSAAAERYRCTSPARTTPRDRVRDLYRYRRRRGGGTRGSRRSGAGRPRPGLGARRPAAGTLRWEPQYISKTGGTT